ncbi:hypothetical protein P171DRAFT_483181 [Karstenula rhodostoma CBS 690.94]|uniref:HSF-type DNA-binding domain-containing protein n=1 Tax=Karstenula rhodostoma CBS 690.94 TaxID=1392251 RepID=A0A9P4PL68_9PLEO|nr:hypothetical protein P171DRAFT_483181 [Karstenula rhodostoma CBS 690.94]
MASEPTHKYTLSTQPLFERSSSPPPAPTPDLRTRSSTLSLRGKRREYGSKALANKSLVGDRNNGSPEQPIQKVSERKTMNSDEHSVPVAAAALPRQPKSVRGVFVRKLYTMLEDQSSQHLISWSSTSDSFIFSPSSEFVKVLVSYFQHTSISSFIRQLNLYGFQKVGNLFHSDAPDSPLWEFKHTDGMFQRGGQGGLQNIKRHPNRAALIAVDSKELKENGVREANTDTILPRGAMSSYEPKEHVSVERFGDYSRQGRQEVSPPGDYALPELDTMIAGWQAMLSHNQAERDSGFHDGDMVDVPQLRALDPIRHGIDDEPMLEESEALVLEYDRANDVHSIPVNNPKLLATVENAIETDPTRACYIREKPENAWRPI